MASAHVVVIDSSARRATVKVPPNKHLSDVLEEACRKLGLKSSNYGLKNNNRTVDLSRTFRLSGLSPGAKLELVQLSKSAGVVAVALQLPAGDAESAAVPNGRLTDKFPSNTSLWQVLRRFEDGVAGGQPKRNLTQRAVPSTDSGAGRLFYQQPVLNIMNREISSLPDLSKSLSQLGYNNGSVLIRLAFKPTETPLEDAATQIARYFLAIEQDEKPREGVTESNQPPSDQPSQPSQSLPTLEQPETPGLSQPLQSEEPEWTHDQDGAGAGAESTHQTKEAESGRSGNDDNNSTVSSSTTRPLSVYRPPTSSAPLASRLEHNESDYTPTIEHAQLHQSHLNQSSRNRRLPTEAEIAATEEAKREELQAVKDVEIRIRFPDQSQVTSTFTQHDSGSSLYSEIRERMLDPPFRNQPFTLKDPSVRQKGDLLVVPDDANRRLILDLGFKGRRLLFFAWAEAASVEARAAPTVLREELRRQAVDVKIDDVTVKSAVDDPADAGVRVNVGKGQNNNDDDDAAGGGGGLGKKMPKWLKGLSKK